MAVCLSVFADFLCLFACPSHGLQSRSLSRRKHQSLLNCSAWAYLDDTVNKLGNALWGIWYPNILFDSEFHFWCETHNMVDCSSLFLFHDIAMLYLIHKIMQWADFDSLNTGLLSCQFACMIFMHIFWIQISTCGRGDYWILSFTYWGHNKMVGLYTNKNLNQFFHIYLFYFNWNSIELFAQKINKKPDIRLAPIRPSLRSHICVKTGIQQYFKHSWRLYKNLSSQIFFKAYTRILPQYSSMYGPHDYRDIHYYPRGFLFLGSLIARFMGPIQWVLIPSYDFINDTSAVWCLIPLCTQMSSS